MMLTTRRIGVVSATFTEDATIMSLFPHMHVRGESFEFRLVMPDGQSPSPAGSSEVRLQLASRL